LVCKSDVKFGTGVLKIVLATVAGINRGVEAFATVETGANTAVLLFLTSAGTVSEHVGFNKFVRLGAIFRMEFGLFGVLVFEIDRCW